MNVNVIFTTMPQLLRQKGGGAFRMRLIVCKKHVQSRLKQLWLSLVYGLKRLQLVFFKVNPSVNKIRVKNTNLKKPDWFKKKKKREKKTEKIDVCENSFITIIRILVQSVCYSLLDLLEYTLKINWIWHVNILEHSSWK